MRVLIVEDDRKVAALLADAFERDGTEADTVGTIAAMRQRLVAARYDLIALDVGLPDGDGVVALQALRRLSDVPVILITGRSGTGHVVHGLEHGADDYIAKPFRVEEVLARAKAVLRRLRPADEGGAASRLSFDGWTMDLMRRTITRPDCDAVRLTAGEFDLLAALIRNANVAMSRDEIRAALGRPPGTYEDRALDMQIRRLRAKIEAEPDRPRYIKTLRGRGYIFAEPVSRS